MIGDESHAVGLGIGPLTAVASGYRPLLPFGVAEEELVYPGLREALGHVDVVVETFVLPEALELVYILDEPHVVVAVGMRDEDPADRGVFDAVCLEQARDRSSGVDDIAPVSGCDRRR